MAENHPFEEQDLGFFKFPTASKRRSFIDEVIDQTRADDISRGEWLDRMEEYYQRRYCRLFRHTNWPWSGASDIVMPTIDMTIDRLKASIVQLILTKPLVTFEPSSPDVAQQARSDEIYFNWLLLRRVPDFRKQVIYGVDNMLSQGFCVFKIFWDYRTRVTHRNIDMLNLPPRYGQMAQEMTREASQRRAIARPLALDVPTQGEIRSVANEVMRQVGEQIARDYGVDVEDEREAVRRIVAGLKGQEKFVDYTVREVEANYPRLVCIDNGDFIVPGGALELQELDRCVHRLWLTPQTFRQRARDHQWDPKAVSKILKSLEKGAFRVKTTSRTGFRRSGRTPADWVRDQREGVSSIDETALIEVYEAHFHHLFDEKKGNPEKAWAVIQPDEGVMLKRVRHEPYNHGKWPFSQVRFELNDNRFHSSRSVGEKIDDIDITVTLMNRARLNYLDLIAPTFEYEQGADLQPENFTFTPGAMYPVTRIGGIKPIEVPDRTLPTEREENSMLTWNERYIGSIENVAAQQNISEARTATEVQALQSGSRIALNHRGLVVQVQFEDIYDQLWDISNQFGSPEEYQRVTGLPMRRKTHTEIQRDFSIVPIGTIETSDPVLEAQKAFARFQTLYQVWLQTGGLVNGTHQIDIAEALIRWLERDNVLDARAIVRALSQQEIQQIQQAEQARQERREAVEDNVPVSIEDLRAEVEELKKEAPRGKRQRVLTPGA
jgi:hypothetical protein